MFKVESTLWFSIGLIGQIVFGLRFVIQWLYSEYKKESLIPISFWYLSIVGSLLLLAYAIYLKDIIFTAGFSLNILIYIRNLMLRHSAKK
ncbi:hypothetical protein DID78_05755 [Candidatus Marinamargulisbacteria bacterium SCGC AG-343-D04]|nr:hypothetical protein DID78_05755 [Candidatus Marinamargulisbacteria bacterium SCGC AG-343-D04]